MADIRTPETLIITTGNTQEPEIVNSNNVVTEPFKPTAYKTIAVNGKGETTANVPLARAAGMNEKLTAEGMEVLGKEILMKRGVITLEKNNKKEHYAFLYDNRLKKIAQVFKKNEEGKLQKISENDYIVAPNLKGKTFNDRIEVLDKLLLFVRAALQSKDDLLKEPVFTAVQNAQGNLKAQGVELTKLSKFLPKLIAVKEIFSKIDFNNSVVKSAYLEYKEDLKNGENLPSINNLKNEEFLNNTFTQIGIEGITFAEFRELTKTVDMLDENATPGEKAKFNEIQKLKKALKIEITISNIDTRYVGINDKGMFQIYENEVTEMPSNGEIYADKGLAKELKPVHGAIGAIKSAVYKPNETEKDKVVNAENTLKEIVSGLLEKENISVLKKHLEKILNEIDINKLYAVNNEEKHSMLNKFEELFNYAKKTIVRNIESEFMKTLNKVLTQGNDRFKNISFGYIREENKDFDKTVLDNEEDVKYVKEHLIFTTVPTLASFGQKLFKKNKTAIGLVAHIDTRNNKILQINKGVNISNVFNLSKLGKTIDDIRNFNGEVNKRIKDANKNILKYFYINNDKNSIKASENFKKSIDLVKDDLSKLVDLLKDKKYNEAKNMVISWDNSENENLKTFAKWSKEIGKNYVENNAIVQTYFALSSKDENTKKAAADFLKNPTLENLEEKVLTNQDLRKKRIQLVQTAKKIDETLNAITLQKEMFNQKLYELNGGLDENQLKWNKLEALAKNMAYNVTNTTNIFYIKNGESVIPNTIDKNYYFVDKDLIESKKVDFQGKQVTIYDFTQIEGGDGRAVDNKLKELESIKKDAKKVVENKFKDVEEKAVEKKEYVKEDENVGIENLNVVEGIDLKNNEEVPNDFKVEKTEEEVKEQDEINALIEGVDEDVFNAEEIDFEVPEDAISPEEYVKTTEEKKTKASINTASKMGL